MKDFRRKSQSKARGKNSFKCFKHMFWLVPPLENWLYLSSKKKSLAGRVSHRSERVTSLGLPLLNSLPRKVKVYLPLSFRLKHHVSEQHFAYSIVYECNYTISNFSCGPGILGVG